MEDEDPAALAEQIIKADHPSAPVEQRLRFQWNVPTGVQPYVPLWLSLVFIGLVIAAIVASVLR